MRYQITNILKHIEQDDFDKGCLPETVQAIDISVLLSSNSITGLIDEMKLFCGADNDKDVLINSCGENGRIDIQVMENWDGMRAQPYEVEAWKKGNQELYLACYSGNIEQVSTPVINDDDFKQYETNG